MAIPASSRSLALDAKNILDINYAFAQTAMLIAAVRLHVFTTLAERPLHTKELADRIHVNPLALEIIVQGLCILQLVSLAKSLRPHETLFVAVFFMASDREGPP